MRNCQSLIKSNICLLDDPVPLLPGICLREMKTYAHQNKRAKMFIAATSTISKDWKQHKYLSRDKQIKKNWSICMQWHNSAVKKKPDTCNNTEEAHNNMLNKETSHKRVYTLAIYDCT